MEAAGRGATSVKVCAIEFVSAEDGDILIDRLESFGSDLLNKIPQAAQLPPGRVEHLLAIIRRDKTGTVYLNELKVHGLMQVKREFKKGDPVSVDDITEVDRLVFDGVAIPKDAGVVFIFSVGWRRAIFYDLSPLLPTDPQDREYDVEAQFGQLYAYLMFQARFKITEHQWNILLDGQWFPFVNLKSGTIKVMLSYVSGGFPLDDLADSIAQEVKASLPNLLARWKLVPAFADHLAFLEQAAERYLANDFISTTAILYPRIEGLMRSHQQKSDPTAQASQKGLAGSAVKQVEAVRHEYTPLLPDKFRQYLETVYFAASDPNAPKIKVSRNSIAHGVAAADECSSKSATISILLVDQLSFCFSAMRSQVVGHDAKNTGTVMGGPVAPPQSPSA